MKKYHVLLKTTVNVVIDIEADSARKAAEKLLDSKFLDLDSTLHQPLGTWQAPVEVSWDEGSQSIIEVSPIVTDDGNVIDYEKSQLFTDSYDQPDMKFPENRQGPLACVRIFKDSHTIEMEEALDLEEKE